MKSEKKVVGTVSLEVKLTQEDVDDIMCGSMEGGITPMWCRRVDVIGEYLGEYASEQISRGGTLRLFDCESDEFWDLDLEKFLKGFGLWLSSRKDPTLYFEGGDVDTCSIDAIDADLIVQFSLFGEQVFA